MNNRMLFTITAVLMGFFGIGFILAPRQVFGLYGVSLDGGGVMLATVAGAAVVALAVLALTVRPAPESAAAQVAVQALLAFFLLKTIVTVVAQLQGVFNALGWSIVLIDALLTTGYLLAWLRQGRAVALGD